MKSDGDELMPRLLPVDPCDGEDEDYNVDEPPRNPKEYLRHVQKEASLCPDVVVAQIDPKKLKKNQSVNISRVFKHRLHWKSQNLDENVVLPEEDDEDGWRRFCLGLNVYLNVTQSNEDTQCPGLDYAKLGFPPFLSIVSKLPQGRWLYALLACLEKPLLPEAHSLIRQLARRCSAVRAQLENKDDERLSALNLMICIVAR
ncbi:Gem-associated protein 2 [Bagarius yarrelli]|uniref:Gem-associated protein 2 n=1 Tax=Bagarius yarrelli TaxID=175774 RepID=A0A556VVV1_BAGYA|nr:Gem-associated protein 2 [Bagarius yarrelli]